MTPKKSLLLAGVAVLQLLQLGCLVGVGSAAGSEGISIRVLWTVSGYVLGKGFTGSEQEAKAYLFKPLDITESQIRFDKQVCKGVVFEREMVAAEPYLRSRWRVTPQQLGIPGERIQVIRTTCDLPGFGEYLRLSDNRLIVPIDGVFYFFEPAVNR